MKVFRRTTSTFIYINWLWKEWHLESVSYFEAAAPKHMASCISKDSLLLRQSGRFFQLVVEINKRNRTSLLALRQTFSSVLSATFLSFFRLYHLLTVWSTKFGILPRREQNNSDATAENGMVKCPDYSAHDEPPLLVLLVLPSCF